METPNRKKEIFAGLSLGLLTGIIIGLSIAQVTGIILGALTSLLAAFFGLREKKGEENGNHLIIGTYGLSCVIFIFCGMYIRTNNLLSPSINKQKEWYKEIGFNDKEIKTIFLVKETGLVPKEYTFSKDAIDSKGKTLLMSHKETAPGLCKEIDEHTPLNEIIASFDHAGLKFEKLEKTLSASIADTVKLKESLLTVKSVLCQE
jgi:hypothetical protein